MGVLGDRNKPKEKTEHTEKSIQKLLREHFMSPNSMKYRIENLKVYSWESDSLSITKSGYVYECEIKISRADFFNDKKKERKHQILEGTYQLRKWDKTYPDRPNYFYYVVPEDLISPDEIPPYAGLIYITEVWPYVKIMVSAPQITKEKIDEEKLNLKDKFYYNYISWKYKAEEEYENTIENLKKELHATKYDEDGKYHKYTILEAEKRMKGFESLAKINEENCELYRNRFYYYSDLCCNLEHFLREKGVPESEVKERVNEFRKKYNEKWQPMK